MQIVINIPDRIYKITQNRRLNLVDGEIVENAIKNGTPLPKEHGDLISKEQAIDLVEFYQLNPQYFDFVNLIDEIKDEKPIIEADKSVEMVEKGV